MKIHLIVALISALIGGGIVLGVSKAIKPEIKVECPQPICPQFKCPEGNNIDFDKVKNFKGTLKVEQHYHIVANGDSLLREKLIADLEAKLNQLRVSRCK